jgi:hypothetical protein
LLAGNGKRLLEGGFGLGDRIDTTLPVLCLTLEAPELRFIEASFRQLDQREGLIEHLVRLVQLSDRREPFG